MVRPQDFAGPWTGDLPALECIATAAREGRLFGVSPLVPLHMLQSLKGPPTELAGKISSPIRSGGHGPGGARACVSLTEMERWRENGDCCKPLLEKDDLAQKREMASFGGKAIPPGDFRVVEKEKASRGEVRVETL